jgi:hypothetical protein
MVFTVTRNSCPSNSKLCFGNAETVCWAFLLLGRSRFLRSGSILRQRSSPSSSMLRSYKTLTPAILSSCRLRATNLSPSPTAPLVARRRAPRCFQSLRDVSSTSRFRGVLPQCWDRASSGSSCSKTNRSDLFPLPVPLTFSQARPSGHGRLGHAPPQVPPGFTRALFSNGSFRLPIARCL